MLDQFLNRLLNMLFFRGRIGELYLDRIHNADGSFAEPDGYLVLKAPRIYDDTRLPHERKPVTVAFTIENRHLAERLTPSVMAQIYSRAVREGYSPLRVLCEGLEYTPFDALQMTRPVEFSGKTAHPAV